MVGLGPRRKTLPTRVSRGPVSALFGAPATFFATALAGAPGVGLLVVLLPRRRCEAERRERRADSKLPHDQSLADQQTVLRC